MNRTGHETSLQRLFTIYSNASNPILKQMYRFYCQDIHQDSNGNPKTLGDFVEHGLIGADYPSTHKCNNIATVNVDPGANPIVNALIAGIAYYQNESINDMMTRMYHFYNYGRLPYYPGCSLMDDPYTLPILMGLNLINPIYDVYTVIDWIWVPCPACLGTGALGYCPICGGDGEILEDIVEVVQEIIGWYATAGIDTFFGYFPDIVNHRFTSAESLYSLYKMNAIELYDTNIEDALIYLGYGLHHLQDVAAVPHHSLNIPFSQGHADWENSIDYSQRLNNITWSQIKQEYDSLKNWIAIDDSLPSQARYGTNKTVFNWASHFCGNQGTDNSQDFTQTAKYTLAAMHHCLYTFFSTVENPTFIAVRYDPQYRSVYDSIRFARETDVFKKTKNKLRKRRIRSALTAARIKKSAGNWTTNVKRALTRREKIPTLPRELSMLPKTKRRKSLKLKQLIH